MSVKAIETVYRGTRFRSRLEARWAVLFDSMKIEWRYEHQGFESGAARYLPDFWLPGDETWCEVKGEKYALAHDYERMVRVLGEGGPLPLLLLGDIPSVNGSATPFHPILWRYGEDGIFRDWAFLLPTKGAAVHTTREADPYLLHMLGLPRTGGMDKKLVEEEWSVEHRMRETVVCHGGAMEAYRAARAARFEHGAEGTAL
jgi:hypothetical protein